MDEKLCTNSTYWQNYRLLSIGIIGIGIIAFLVLSLMLIRYLYVHNKGKRSKKKIIFYIVSIVASLIVFTGGALLANYIKNETKDKMTCYSLD